VDWKGEGFEEGVEGGRMHNKINEAEADFA